VDQEQVDSKQNKQQRWFTEDEKRSAAVQRGQLHSAERWIQPKIITRNPPISTVPQNSQIKSCTLEG